MKRSSILGGPEECAICMNQYDRYRRLPTLVCSNRHTVCGECLEDISREASKCPFCREPIRLPSTALNLDIFTRLPERGRAEVNRQQHSYVRANFRFNVRQREEAQEFQGANWGQLNEYIRPPEVENQEYRIRYIPPSDEPVQWHRPNEEWTYKDVLIRLFFLLAVVFNIAVAVISLEIVGSSSQCSNVKINSQARIRQFFGPVGVFTILGLVAFLCVAMGQVCGKTMNASSWISLGAILFVDNVIRLVLFLIFFLAIPATSALNYCPSSFSVFTFVIFAGLAVFLILNCCLWIND